MPLVCGLRLSRTPTAEPVTEALRVAVAHEVTACDACYAVLARRFGAQLVTADEKLIRKLE